MFKCSVQLGCFDPWYVSKQYIQLTASLTFNQILYIKKQTSSATHMVLLFIEKPS